MASRNRIRFLFLNVGHFYTHFFMLVFATVAALSLAAEWKMGYADLIPYATPVFLAFGLCALPAGWLADKWNREGMMLVFFIGIGVSGVGTALAQNPFQVGVGLFFIGVFASIYHPVGLALVVERCDRIGMPIAINGVAGNMGVACVALVTGLFVEHMGWRPAFVWPGVVALLTGAAYGVSLRAGRDSVPEGSGPPADAASPPSQVPSGNRSLVRIFGIVFFSTAVGGLVFQSTTFALPKVFEERLVSLAMSPSLVGWYAFLVFAVAALGQLVVGYLIDRYAVRTVFGLVASIQAICFAIMPGLKGWSALAVATGFMLAVFGQIPINDVLVGRITRSEWRSRVYALRYIVTFSVMAASVPLIAWAYSWWGFDTLFRGLSAAAVCILAAVLMHPGEEASGARDEEIHRVEILGEP